MIEGRHITEARGCAKQAARAAYYTSAVLHDLAYSNPLVIRLQYNKDLHAFDVTTKKARFWQFRKKFAIKVTLETLEEFLPPGIVLRHLKA